MKDFQHEVGDKVVLIDSNENGTVIGRAEYLDDTPSYYVRYVDATGHQKQGWFNARDIKVAE